MISFEFLRRKLLDATKNQQEHKLNQQKEERFQKFNNNKKNYIDRIVH